MGWDGMLPQHDCRGCGKPLDADGGHPAELYQGTYTGLCYACQDAPPYVVEEYPDGAKRISYPPHCPSYRRDREEFTAFNDCPHCEGKGRQIVSRPDQHGGDYPRYCAHCVARHDLEMRKREGVITDGCVLPKVR